MRIWLVTEERLGVDCQEEVVAMINYRRTDDFVKRFVEITYSRGYTFSCQLARARMQRSRTPPLMTARRERNGYCCGANPCLYGRLVLNPRIELDEHGNEHLAWDELPPPHFARDVLPT